jgi:hypothetical protein
MIVAEVFTNQPPQVGFIEHHHVIQQFSAAAPHPSFGNPILPRALIGCSDQFATHGLEYLCGFSLVLPVSIEDQVARCGVFGKGLSQLLHDPRNGRMFGGVEVEDSPPAAADRKEAVQHAESGSRNREEIHRCNDFPVVLQKDLPELARIFITAHSSKVPRDRALRASNIIPIILKR